jgi:uncharacterized protein DUF5678
MKPAAKKPRAPKRKKATRGKSPSVQNGFASPYGSRVIENEWLQKHPEKLRACVGEYVMVEGEEIVAHSKEPAELVRVAKERGIKIPYIFFVEPPLPPNTYRIGWL